MKRLLEGLFASVVISLLTGCMTENGVNEMANFMDAISGSPQLYRAAGNNAAMQGNAAAANSYYALEGLAAPGQAQQAQSAAAQQGINWNISEFGRPFYYYGATPPLGQCID